MRIVDWDCSRGEACSKFASIDPMEAAATKDVFKTRSPPSLLCQVIKEMTQGQRNVVTQMGFRSILELNIKEIPPKLGYYVLSKLDTEAMVIRTTHGDIKVNEEAVHEVYGFPMGTTTLNFSRIGNSNNVATIKAWKEHLGLGDNVRPTTLAQKMKVSKDVNYMFKLDFLVLMVSTLIHTMQNGRVNLRFLKSVTNNSEFKEFNWCEFVVKAAKECKEDWKPNDKNSLFVGPLTFLVLLFCDRVRVAPEIERVRSVITKWKSYDLTKLEENNDFGSYELLPAWRETTSGKAYLVKALYLEKDVHFNGCGCSKKEGDDVGEDAKEQTEEEAVESVVKEINCLRENFAIARDHLKRRLDDAVICFGGNKKIQSIKEKWNSTFPEQPFIIENDDVDGGYIAGVKEMRLELEAATKMGEKGSSSSNVVMKDVQIQWPEDCSFQRPDETMNVEDETMNVEVQYPEKVQETLNIAIMEPGVSERMDCEIYSPNAVGVSSATGITSSGPESTSQSVPGSSSIAPTTLLQFAKTRKLSIERSDPRNQALLHRGSFFHSHRAQPMAPEYVFGDEDSEDEVDDDVADLEDRRMLDDFIDVTQHEKQMMHLWNSFIRKQRVLADAHIPWACEAFSTQHGEDFVQTPEVLWCWSLFMIKLWNHGLLDAKTMNSCNLILDNFRERNQSQPIDYSENKN